jgi:hypothetical protein
MDVHSIMSSEVQVLWDAKTKLPPIRKRVEAALKTVRGWGCVPDELRMTSADRRALLGDLALVSGGEGDQFGTQITAYDGIPIVIDEASTGGYLTFHKSEQADG